jgi:hypothetical protein
MMRNTTNRRSLVSGAIAMAAVGTHVAQQGLAAQGATPEAAEAEENGWVDAPRWRFRLHAAEDPYAGTLQVPTEPPAGSRVVAVEVEVLNEADQPLAFTPIDVRLRDAGGTEYRGGAAIGAEPMINPRNMNPGELSRGWVWFIVPSGADAVEIVYVAPQPQFRVSLP